MVRRIGRRRTGRKSPAAEIGTGKALEPADKEAGKKALFSLAAAPARKAPALQSAAQDPHLFPERTGEVFVRETRCCTRPGGRAA